MRLPLMRRDVREENIRPIRTIFDDFIKNALYDVDEEEKMMAMDVVERKNEFILTANMPGIKKENIRVNVQSNDLVIEGQRDEEEKCEDETTFRCERYQGNYRRAFTIPENWDRDKIKAKYDNGVLRLTIPKKKTQEEKYIEIT